VLARFLGSCGSTCVDRNCSELRGVFGVVAAGTSFLFFQMKEFLERDGTILLFSFGESNIVVSTS